MDKSTTQTDIVVSSYIRQLMAEQGVTQEQIGECLGGRSKGYVSDRILGKRSWAISELDRVASLLHAGTAVSLVVSASEARKKAGLPPDSELWGLAANVDEHRDEEGDTPRD